MSPTRPPAARHASPVPTPPEWPALTAITTPGQCQAQHQSPHTAPKRPRNPDLPEPSSYPPPKPWDQRQHRRVWVRGCAPPAASSTARRGPVPGAVTWVPRPGASSAGLGPPLATGGKHEAGVAWPRGRPHPAHASPVSRWHFCTRTALPTHPPRTRRAPLLDSLLDKSGRKRGPVCKGTCVDRWAGPRQAPGTLCHIHVVTAPPQGVCQVCVPHGQARRRKCRAVTHSAPSHTCIKVPGVYLPPTPGSPASSSLPWASVVSSLGETPQSERLHCRRVSDSQGPRTPSLLGERAGDGPPCPSQACRGAATDREF